MQEGLAAAGLEGKIENESRFDRSDIYSTYSSTYSMLSKATAPRGGNYNRGRPDLTTSNVLDTIKETPGGFDESTMLETESTKHKITAANRKKYYEYCLDNETEQESSQFQVLVVEVLNDCQIGSHSPVFFDLVEQDGRMIPSKQWNANTAVSRKDVNFIDKAIKYDIDFIAVNDVTSADSLKEVRHLCRKKPNTKYPYPL